jgi:DNA-binding CsgD family transcriptional regulator/tetratricopeptide (TPR) repeat protein
MSEVDALDQGRESFHRQAWGKAYTQLSAAAAEKPLELEDLEHLAITAYLSGRDAESEGAWTKAHHEALRAADWARAARCAFWLGITLINRMERAQGSGWLARAQRVLDDAQHACVERGWLLIPLGLRQYYQGDFESSADTWTEAGKIGAAYGDIELVTMARQGQGRVLMRLGRTAEGVALLDEAMVAVAAGELSAIPAGIVYCSVIKACQEILDVRRAHEWTQALSGWVAAQPELVPYRGRCLIHRSEILQLHGSWPNAIEEAQRACERLAQPPQPQLGMAYYQRAELHRLRGEFAEAEASYHKAGEYRRRPEPGLSLLRLAQGQIDAAAAAIGRAVDEAKDPVSHSKLLPAYVEIMLAANDIGAARVAVEELSQIANDMDVPFVQGVAARAQGAVLLAEGETRAALEALHNAAEAWHELEVPYEVARLRVLVGLACREIEDAQGAEMEFDAARRTFQQLGATPDLARLKAITETMTAAPETTSGLTAREVQVLVLVASGRTNREIAAALVISERTVARHMANIFTKLNVSSRTAATAFAFEHGLVKPRRGQN